MFKCLKRLNIVTIPSVLLACSPGASDEGGINSEAFASQDIIGISDVEFLSDQNAVIRDDLKEAFCVHVYRLPLSFNFDYELSYLCNDNQEPAEFFLDIDRYAGLVGKKPRSVRMAVRQSESSTQASFATVYRVPFEPKWVRSAQIGSFMTSASDFDYVSLHGDVLEDLGDELGGDLQFGKQRLYYHTTVQTPDGESFSNERTTELNSYQVQGGNPNIGIGAEHLLDSPNQRYQTYNTITVTIANNDKSSTLITIIQVSVDHHGFPDLAEQVVSDIATAQASHVHNGLRRSLIGYEIAE